MLYEAPFITIYSVVLTGIFGACMGSFLNCMAWRIVHGEPVSKGRSHCDLCGHVLGPADLVPAFSYLVHHGRCRYCGEKLSSRHVWAEVISAVVFVTILLQFNISLQALKFMVFASVMLASSFADLEGYIIPDRFILTGLFARIVFLFFEEDPRAEGLDSLIGGLAVAAAVLAVVLIFEKIRGIEAMGGGDIKLLFVTGLYLGWKGNILCLFAACIIGIIFGLTLNKQAGLETETEAADADGQYLHADDNVQNAELSSESSTDGSDADEEIAAGAFPWGPSIAIAAWLVLLFGNRLIDWYLSFF